MNAVRTACLTDAHEIARIVRELNYFAHIAAEAPDATSKRIEKNLQSCISDQSHSVYVCEDGEGKVVGYCAVHWLPNMILKGAEGYLSELFVDEKCRGMGIGSLLLDTVRAEAEKRGCWRLILQNMKNRESYQRKFYKKRGWQERDLAAIFVLYLKD